MGFLSIYKNTPTAGGTDGTKVVTGNPIVTPYLDLASSGTTDIKLAVRCESGKKTLADTTITPKSPMTTLAAVALAGAQTITVTSAVGLQVNNLIDVGGSETKETKRIVLITDAMLTLDSALVNAQASGAAVVCRSKYQIALAKDVDGSPGSFGDWGAALILPYLATPKNILAATFATGGSLAAGTYSYRVTAYNTNGETLASIAVAITVPIGTSTNEVELSWDAVTGATGYKIYGRTAGTELLIATATSAAYTDTGESTPSGTLPTASTVQITDVNTIFWAQIRALAMESVPYKDVAASIQVAYMVGGFDE